MPAELCPVRLELSNRVTETVAALYKAKREYEAAKERKAENLSELHMALLDARNAERDAVCALDDHAQSHGCKGMIS